jgi:hypothetical protein
VVPPLANRWSHHWQGPGPMLVAKLALKWSLLRGRRHDATVIARPLCAVKNRCPPPVSAGLTATATNARPTMTHASPLLARVHHAYSGRYARYAAEEDGGMSRATPRSHVTRWTNTPPLRNRWGVLRVVATLTV